jgi:precorrin-2 dehydrogenase/sirohydrochlorin ferrochelatase
VNDAIVRDARARNVLVSRADQPDEADFALPAIHRDGPITVAVSSNSPALSAFIRDELAERLDPAYRALADQVHVIRPLVTDSDLPPEQRAEILRSMATRDAVELLRSAGEIQFQIWLLQRFPELKPIIQAGR